MTETESGTNLSKKQLKALKFKAKSSNTAADELKVFEEKTELERKRKLEEEQAAKKAAEEIAKAEAEAPPKKKRKTRRGKKGKGSNKEESNGPKFILFVGNLPFKTTEDDIKAHFKNCMPTSIRLRNEKGCAFIEFKNDDPMQSKRLMDVALRLHKSTLGGRKINVELTAGGGGNSQERIEKIKAKNEKLEQERLDRLRAEKEKKAKSDAKKTGANDETPVVELEKGVHPDRAKMLGL